MRVFASRMAEGETSPKAVLAFLYPFIATLIGVAATWIVTGEFNVEEIRTGVAGLLASGLAFFGAWLGKPGVVDANPAVASPSPNR